MPQLLVLSPRSGGPSRRPQVAFGSDHLRPRGRCLGPIPGGLGGALCLLLASPCWTWDCQKVGALGQRWEGGRGRGLGLVPPHCVGPGLMLQGWFRPSEPRWTPSRRRAKGRLAQIGSIPVVFFSLALEGWSGRRQRCCTYTDWRRSGRCLAPASREETGTLAYRRDPGEAEGVIMGLSPRGYPATTGPSR